MKKESYLRLLPPPPWRYSPNLGLGLPPWNSPFHFGFLELRQSVGLLGRVISSSQGLYLYTNTEKCTHTQTLNIHVLSGIRTHDPGFRASEDSAWSATVTGHLRVVASIKTCIRKDSVILNEMKNVQIIRNNNCRYEDYKEKYRTCTSIVNKSYR
jgi:hypothetical protein